MSFAARSHLRRTLEYRPHIRISYKALLGFAALSFVLVIAFAIYYATVAQDLQTALWILVGGLLAPLILALEAHFLARPLASTRVHVREDGLTIDRMGQSLEVPYSTVKQIRFSHTPYIGGWFELLLESGEKHRFTVVLERSEYVLEAIVAARPGIVSEEDLVAFRRAAILSDHSWARVYSKLKGTRGLLLKYLVLPAILAAITIAVMKMKALLIDGPGMIKLFMLVAGLNFAVGLSVSFALSEFVLLMVGRERLTQDPKAVVRDLVLEAQVDRYAQIGHWILAFAILAFALIR